MNGNPVAIDGAGLNQKQLSHDSFFDVYFSVDLGNGNHEQGLLGMDMIPPSPITPAVTGAGLIAYPAFSRTQPGDPCRTALPGDPCRATFLVDPMAFEVFNINLLPNPTLTDPPPPLTPNSNVAPEPSYRLLAALAMAGLFVRRRRSSQA